MPGRSGMRRWASRGGTTRRRRFPSTCSATRCRKSSLLVPGNLVVTTRVSGRAPRAEHRGQPDAPSDVVVMVESDGDAEQLVRSLTEEGYGLSALVEQDAVGRRATVRLISPDADGVGVVVDLIFATAGIEAEIVADAEVLEILPAVSLPVATVGHLVALKLLARDDETRPQDAADLRALAWCSVPGIRRPPEPPSGSSWNAVTPGDDHCRQCWTTISTTPGRCDALTQGSYELPYGLSRGGSWHGQAA